MKSTKIKHPNYTKKCNTSQLVLPLDFSLFLDENCKVTIDVTPHNYTKTVEFYRI